MAIHTCWTIKEQERGNGLYCSKMIGIVEFKFHKLWKMMDQAFTESNMANGIPVNHGTENVKCFYGTIDAVIKISRVCSGYK